MKKIFITIIAMLLPLMASAYTYTITKGGICYNLNTSKETATVISSTYGYSGDIVIPSRVFDDGDYYDVTTIGYEAFRGCGSLTSITIPPSVTRIQEDAFRNCTSLNSVHIYDLEAWLKVKVDVGTRDGGIDE